MNQSFYWTGYNFHQFTGKPTIKNSREFIGHSNINIKVPNRQNSISFENN